MNRRIFLFTGAAALAASRRAKIAAIITTYYRNSHADVFIGNMLRGYYWEGKRHESELEIVAMYLARTPSNDREMPVARSVSPGHRLRGLGATSGGAGRQRETRRRSRARRARGRREG